MTKLTQQDIKACEDASYYAAMLTSYEAMGFDFESDLDLDDEERLQQRRKEVRDRDENYGTFGPVLVDQYGNTHIHKPLAQDANRGRDRNGWKAADFMAEAVFSNTTTTTLFEVPAIIIKSIRISNPQIKAHDLAVYWFLFAHARLNGMEHESHSIKLSTIRHYLGVRAVARVVAMLERLAATEVSYHFRQPGHYGRKSMPLVTIAVPDGKLLGDSEIEYSLPEAVRYAVLDARSHAWINLNALPRLTSRFSFPVFMRLALSAGMLAEARKPIALSEEHMAQIMDSPMSLGLKEINRRIDCVVADIEALGRAARRFDFSSERIVYNAYEANEEKNPLYPNGTRCVRFIAGTSARRLREVRPCAMSKDFWKFYKVQIIVPKKWTPHLTCLRLAATLARVPLNELFQQWNLDILDAQNYGKPAAGLEGEDFIRSLDVIGPDHMLEHWVEHRDFGDLVFGKIAKDRKAAADKAEQDMLTEKYGPRPQLKTWKPDYFKKKRAVLPQPVPVSDVDDYEDDVEDYSTGDYFGDDGLDLY